MTTVAALREELESRGWAKAKMPKSVDWIFAFEKGMKLFFQLSEQTYYLCTASDGKLYYHSIKITDYPTASALVDAIETFVKGE